MTPRTSMWPALAMGYSSFRSAALGLLTLGCLASTAQAQFVPNTADIPSGAPDNASSSENVDFGDVDLDGDWDAVFADGGDNSLDQNRLWINDGPGANLGVFIDRTVAQFPSVNDQSRDIEFVDYDNDGDIDLHVSNTSSLVASGCRWWTNVGVGSGSYVDETAARWVNLGGPGSSISPGQVIGTGGFIDYTCDSDFADVDNDGDMDLFHSSYGGAFGGQNPSRIFLNDGNGFFEEFNPSAFQLAQQTIQNGNPGLWCEGVQQANTTNSTGVFCDIASSALDIDFGDIDGDFDLDLLHGARQEMPRMFTNRLEESGGVLGFRDTTGASFQAGYSTGTGHYEQEMGDMDGDGDLDILGVNWLSAFGFDDATLENDGTGFFFNPTTLPGSGPDDNEGDFIDYDNDGDLDILIANWSGDDRLYRNTINGGANFNYIPTGYPSSPNVCADADVCDVDGDGDYDVFSGVLFNQPNYYFENVSQVPDTHAPYIPNVEQAPDRVPSAEPTVVRAHVYDNAPYYITWYNETQLVYRVNGGAIVTVPARSSGGQVFRAEIPGALMGTIEYRFESWDEYGNTGGSPVRNYVSGAPGSGSGYCFGDGSGTPCPCGATGVSISGCPNSVGPGAVLVGSGLPVITNDGFQLSVSGVTGPCLVLQGLLQIGGGSGNPAGEGLLCTAGQSLRSQVQLPQAGATTFTDFLGAPFGAAAILGPPTNYQCWYRDPANTCNGGGFNFSNAWTVLWLP